MRRPTPGVLTVILAGALLVAGTGNRVGILSGVRARLGKQHDSRQR